MLKSLPIDQNFAAPDEAEQSGVDYAKKWIDDGNRTKAYDPPRDRARMDQLDHRYVETHDQVRYRPRLSAIAEIGGLDLA